MYLLYLSKEKEPPQASGFGKHAAVLGWEAGAAYLHPRLLSIFFKYYSKYALNVFQQK